MLYLQKSFLPYVDSNSSTQDLLNSCTPIQSQNCEHYFCLDCIQSQHTDKTTSWTKCLFCYKGNAFQLDNPIVYRALVTLASLKIDVEQYNNLPTNYGGATVIQEDGMKEEVDVNLMIATPENSDLANYG
jgi:hypothetical protein